MDNMNLMQPIQSVEPPKPVLPNPTSFFEQYKAPIIIGGVIIALIYIAKQNQK